jgi:acyl carrier protein
LIRRAVSRAVTKLVDGARARASFGDAEVGPSVRILGFPSVACEGTLVVGARAVFVATPAPITIVVGKGATVEIGEGAVIESGAVLRARRRVTIGRNARVGVGCVVDDETSEGGLRVEDGAWLADGTFVTGVTTSNEKTNGVNGVHHDATVDHIRGVVGSIIAEATQIDGATDLRRLRGFDSLAALRVVVALEKELGVSLPHDLFAQPRTLESIAAIAHARATA